MKLYRNKLFITGCISVFIISFLIFFSIIQRNIFTDIQLHANFLWLFSRGEDSLRPHFLYYVAVYILSLKGLNLGFIHFASVMTLAISKTMTFAVTYYVIVDMLNHNNLNTINNHKIIPLILSFCMIFAFSVPGIQFYTHGYFYLKSFSPNVWHNSTVIFLAPFAIALFWISYKQLISYQRNRIWLILILIFLNIFSKPHYFIVFSLAFPVLFLQKYKLSKPFLNHALIVIIGYLFLLVFMIYRKTVFTEASNSSSIAINPFSQWKAWLPLYYIPFAMAGGYLFPLFTILLSKSKLLSIGIRYVTLSVCIGLVVGFVFIETGEKFMHGNFTWQNKITSYLFYLVTFLLMIKEYYSKILSKKRFIFLLSLFGLHVASGIIYILRIFITRSYY